MAELGDDPNKQTDQSVFNDEGINIDILQR